MTAIPSACCAPLPIPWNADPPAFRRQIEQNVVAVARRIREEAVHREPPTVDMAKQLHRDIYQGIPLPVPYYAGEVRDSDPRYPELIGYEVAVGPLAAVPSADVPAALARFEQSMQRATRALDAALSAGVKPGNARELTGVIQLAGIAHGEWIRIHPFAIGNGRTARLWVAWVASRYGLPLFLQLRPRPAGTRYAVAAGMSMLGNHSAIQLYLADMLAQALGQAGPGP
jgi:fido (protein-threonine AMPylation protein)